MTGEERNQEQKILKKMEEKDVMEKRFMSIRETSRFTGISECYLRKGIRENTIPHFMSGCKALINVPLFLESMDEQSRRSVNGKQKNVFERDSAR